MIFNPSRDDVRRFFCDTWRKRLAGELLTPLEAMASGWIDLHPEYHELLADPQRAATEEFPPEGGATNPFLHLSMHLALDEQVSIDQPQGIRAVFETLLRQTTAHEAAHEAMECLGEIVWRAQRGTLPQDTEVVNAAYLDCLRRRASLRQGAASR
jgi:hypothetical protein